MTYTPTRINELYILYFVLYRTLVPKKETQGQAVS
jgi:hypothetical protein